ncbi:MAG: hypothetical protein M5U09_29180 [Gammaproteobacteria bacterium]|nr:hypothetical protein [Gammaproteobacteria bacterium]
MNKRLLCLLAAAPLANAAHATDLLDAYRMALANDPAYQPRCTSAAPSARTPTSRGRPCAPRCPCPPTAA